MRCASALSTHPIASHATGDVLADILEQRVGRPALALVFVTPSFSGACEDILDTVQSILQPEVLLSLTSSGVIGAGSEVCRGSSLALWVVWNDGTGADTKVKFLSLDDGIDMLEAEEIRSLRSADGVILLGDPSVEHVIQTIDRACALTDSTSVSGALLSSSRGSAQLREVRTGPHDVVALVISEPSMDSAIAHGSVPLGRTMLVSRSIGTLLCELEDEPALEAARRALSTLDPADQPLAARNLALAVHDIDSGALIDVHRVLGADKRTGALAITSEITEGSLVAFHHQDRDGALSGLERSLGGPRSQGAIVFTCTPIDPDLEREGVGELDVLTDALGTSAFAGAHVSAVIGSGPRGSGLRAAPLSAAIFGRDHY